MATIDTAELPADMIAVMLSHPSCPDHIAAALRGEVRSAAVTQIAALDPTDTGTATNILAELLANGGLGELTGTEADTVVDALLQILGDNDQVRIPTIVAGVVGASGPVAETFLNAAANTDLELEAEHVVSVLVGRNNLPDAVVAAIAAHPELLADHELGQLARHPACPGAIADPAIVQFVIRNRNDTYGVEETFDQYCRLPQLSETTYAQLAEVGNRWARLIAANPHVPATLLDELAHHSAARVRLAAAQNPSTPAVTLVELANRSISDIQTAACSSRAVAAVYGFGDDEQYARWTDTVRELRRPTAGRVAAALTAAVHA